MRILALHGYRTNGRILQTQLKSLASKLPASCDIVCLDAPHEATGEPEEVVKVAFPNERQFYEWYSYEKQNDGSYKYMHFESSVKYICSVILAQSRPFDILLGFSQVRLMMNDVQIDLFYDRDLIIFQKQGGCFGAILTYMCEHGLLDIPSHKRWKYAVLLSAPFPRGDKSFGANDEACATPMLLGFGARDKLIDASQWKLKNARIVTYDETHALPRLPASVNVVAEALNTMTRRFWVAFDFDGVICDSARETGKTAWRAAEDIIPNAKADGLPSDEVLNAFCLARPLLETGFEALVILYRICVLNQNPQGMLASLTPQEDMEKALALMNRSKEELKERFQIARESWIKNDESGWLSENGFYMPTVEAARQLIESGHSVYVITTKHQSFASKLLQSVGIKLPLDRIFGLGSGPKRDVLASIAREREAIQGGECIFIEDRTETLRDVARNGRLPATLVLAGYGYNTSIERQTCVEKDGFLVHETSEGLAKYLLQRASSSSSDSGEATTNKT